MGSPYAFVLRLTWSGHELLDQLRNDTFWNRLKKAAEEKGLALTLESIGVLAKYVIAKALG